jgi:myosin heavy subunit
VASRDELMKLEDILGISADQLERCMTSRVLKTGYDEVQVQLSPAVAKDSTDALAKEIYARIFDVLVRSINEYTRARIEGDEIEELGDGNEVQSKQSEMNKFGVICLLDIFGFERFQVNRFEQLCINYANEHLQHKYVLDNFRAVQEEYESEGIELFDFAVVDNSDVLNLLENRLGILMSLNEECVRPKGNDESFVYKIKIVNKDHDRIIDKKLHRKTEFGIRHFAGPVTYDATKFVERNTDKLPEDLIECVSQSSNQIISTEFKSILDESKTPKEPIAPGKRKPSSKTVIQKFRLQLKDLMDNIQDTTTRYIRCIKPNDNMIPKMTDHYTTMRQLECAGLVTAITISRETFPNRLGYETTRERFDCLMTKQDSKYMDSVSDKEAVQFMLSNLLPQMLEEKIDGKVKLPFACGNTRVYFRAGALEFLETRRLDYYTQRVILIQNWIRQINAQERYRLMRAAAVRIQAMARGRLELKRYQEKKLACTRLAAWVRGRQATALVQSIREDKAAVLLQNTWRTKSKAYQLSRMKKAVVVIQRAVRNREKREKFSAKLAVAVEEARMDNKLLGLKNEVSQTVATKPKKGMVGRQINEELLQEVESMFDYLRKEIFMLRQNNGELKAHLRLVEEEKRELDARAETAEATATASRLQVTTLTKSRAKLNKTIDDYKHEVSGLKKHLKAIESEQLEKAASVKVDYDNILQEKNEEINQIKRSLNKTMKRHELDIIQLQQQATKIEEGHVTEIMRLKDELRRTQESHHDYLAKLMDVLETTHQAREQETARIANELLIVKEEKDSQIHDLQREVETLRRIKMSGPATSSLTIPKLENKIKEVTLVRQEFDRNSAARQQRTQKFMEVSSRLVDAVSPDNLVTITSARRARGKTMSVVEEETIRMKKMIRFLGDLYNLETTSQGKVDEELLKSMDSYMAALEPNTALMKMELLSQQLEAENKRLKGQISAQGQCPRCEARDKRRMNRNRSNRSPTRDMNSNRSHDGSRDGM